MEEAIQIALQEEYSHRQACTPATAYRATLRQPEDSRSRPSGSPQARRSRAAAATQEPGKCRTPVGAGRPTGEDLSLHDGHMGGTRHGGLAPESPGTLESRKSSDRLLVVHGCVRGYGNPFRILIDSGASKHFARRQSVARNADKFADALREYSGAGPVSVRLANGSLVEVPRVLMDMSVKFEVFNSTKRLIVLEMDKFDLILDMPWLEKHEPWINWRGKAIGTSWPALPDRASVSHVPTSVKSKGVREDRQGASAPAECMEVAEVFGVPQDVTVDSVKESVEAPPGVKPTEPREASRSGWASCPACGATKSVDPDTGSRCDVRASTDKVLQAAHQMGNLVPPEQGISRREPSVGNVVPYGVRKALIAWEAGDTASNVGKLVPREPELNSSSVTNEDILLEEFRKQRASRLGSEILKNPKDPVNPLVMEFEDVATVLTPAGSSIKASLQHAPILALPDESKPFSVVCDTSDYAIDCALLQSDEDGHERVISFQSRQLKAAERNYPVHDKELLAMKYALVEFRVHLPGSRPFVVNTDHASLRTATNSPHLSQRMARWLSFFAEYNFRVEYKPDKLNVLADALSRRPDYELAHISRVTTDLYDRIRLAYRDDESCASLARFFAAGDDAEVKWLSPRQRARLHRFEWADGLLYYRVEPGDPPRVVVPNDEYLKFDILQEAPDAPSSGHLGREKTFLSVSQTFGWSHQYKWVAKYVKTCETCQRIKPFGHASAPLQSLTVPLDCWKSMSLDFVFGLPADDYGNTGILAFVCRLSKMVHLAPVLDTVTGEQAARLFVDCVFRHGLPETIVSDRDRGLPLRFGKRCSVVWERS
ncbi:unnamed protein product [Phytophthora fragariaefolia]|uniref:Unnamed protein product n=1 Tax=Phytophthora fragariaefolia TaxID=1490495 RepID=A0A9W7CFE0_9STRA|nr:unnamed protein product [Phytophthora fragariaefolia]